MHLLGLYCYTVTMKLTPNDITTWKNHWRRDSSEALSAAKDLFATKHYHHALFFCHLSLEKILKAYYLVQKNRYPPPIHDLLRLAKKSGLILPKAYLTSLSEINTFNIRARYDDIKRSFYKKATKKYAAKWLKISEKLLEEIRKKL